MRDKQSKGIYQEKKLKRFETWEGCVEIRLRKLRSVKKTREKKNSDS